MSYSPAVAKLLVEKYGFVTQPDGAVVSPGGYTRNEAGKTVKYTAPAADPVASAAPVVAADPVTANLDPVFVPLDNPNASMADVKQNGLDQLMALANQTAASNQQLSDQLGFGSGIAALPPEPELTPIQQVAQELKGLVDTVGLGSKSKKRNDDRIVFFNDGTKTSDVLKKYGVTMDEWRDATKVPGEITGGISNREQAVGRKVSQIEYALMSDEERQEVKDKHSAAQALAKKDKDAFYGKGADSTGRLTSGAEAKKQGKKVGDFSDSYDNQQARLATKTGGGVAADFSAAKDDLVTRGGQLGGDLKDLASSVGGGITNLVDKGKQFFGGTAPGAITSDDGSNVGLRPAGLDNFGYDEDGEVFDSATYSTTPNIFGEVGRGSGYNIPTSVGGGSSSDDVYQDAILRGGGPSSLDTTTFGTDDRGFTSGVLPSSMLGQFVGDNDFNRFQKLRPYGPNDNPQIAFLKENDSEWFEDWEDRFFNFGITGKDRQDAFPAFLDEIQDRYNSFLTGERGDRGPTVTVAGSEGLDGYQGLAYDELGPSPGDLAAIGGDVATLGEGMGEGQDQIYIGVDGTYNPIGGGDDTSLNEGQGDIFTNVDPVTYDPITEGDDSGGGGAASGGDTGGGASGGGDQGGDSGGGGGSDPDIPDGVVIPDPVDPDPDPDPDDPVGSDPLVPFIPSNIQVPSFLQPSLVPYSGNPYVAPSMDFIRANQVNPFADPYANVFVARNGGIVSLR